MTLKIIKRCTACGKCIDECPQKAIEEGPYYFIVTEKCVECGLCEELCPKDAVVKVEEA